MAKIVHTALVQSIHKKMGGSILRRGKGHSLMSQGQRPRNPRSSRQQQLRHDFNYLAGKWGTLNSTQREMWNTHASQLDQPMSGFNDYVSMNTRLLAASYSTLVPQATPPTTPETPTHIDNLRILKFSATQNTISWQTPRDPALYIQLYRSTEPGFSYTGKQRWTHIETVPTHMGQIQDVHAIPEEIPLRYRIIVIDPQGRLSPPTHIVTAPIEALLYLCDERNHRIKEYTTSPLTYADQFGTYGSGNNQLNRPRGIAPDGLYLYLCDTWNNRIKKHDRATFDFIAQIGGLNTPRGLCVDDTHIYVCDLGNDRVTKHLKSDLSIIDTYGVTIFDNPYGVTADDTHLYVTMSGTNLLHKVLKSDMTFVSSYGSPGGGDDQFNDPFGITSDDTHLFICDASNHRIKKHLKSDWTFVSAFGTEGNGDDQFDLPVGIAVHGDYLFIADNRNHRIKVHRKDNLSYVEKTGSYGAGVQEFKYPFHPATWPT